ncbi:hypothetical protein Tco_1096190, partial [Tanacetum coccineum]
MAPLPAADQRHPWLRYQVEGYIKGIIYSYEQRLETIWSRPVNRVHVLDFEGLTPRMRQDLEVRMSDTEMGLDVADTLAGDGKGWVRRRNRLMAKPIPNKAQEQNPAKPRDESNVKIKFSKELLNELQNNTFSGRCEEDVIGHIGKDTKEWWINEGDGNISTWDKLVKKLFKKFYPLSCASNYDKICDDDEEEIGKEEELLNEEVSSNDEWEEHKFGNPPNDSFPKPYLNINNEENKYHYDENNGDGDKLSGMDLSGAPRYENINNEQPNEGICRVDKFKVIKYTIRGNEDS